MIIENAYHGSGFGVTCKHNGRVDQLEDRYLGMVEAPSSNLGTSTPFLLIYIDGVNRAAKTVFVIVSRFMARHVHHSVHCLRA